MASGQVEPIHDVLLASGAGAGIRLLGFRANKARRPVGLAELRSGLI
jgi:hypothetical protein